jgi:hypothetical protein
MRHPVAAMVGVVLLLASLAVGDDKQPLTFHLTVMGEIEDTAATKAGFHTANFRTTHLGFHKYEASDGEQVFIDNGDFKYADEAARYFDWTLEKKAAQVVTEEDKRGPDGKAVGRRAEFLAKSATKEKTWVVMWTEGERFHLISAPTLECALVLERQSRN